MNQFPTYEFAQKWQSMTEPAEVVVHGSVLGRYTPGVPENSEALPTVAANVFQTKFRHLREATVVTRHGRPAGLWEPNMDLPPAGRVQRINIPLDGADPYSEAMTHIRYILEWAFNHRGAMSEGEFGILAAMVGVMAEEDQPLMSPDLHAFLAMAEQQHKVFLASIT